MKAMDFDMEFLESHRYRWSQTSSWHNACYIYLFKCSTLKINLYSRNSAIINTVILPVIYENKTFRNADFLYTPRCNIKSTYLLIDNNSNNQMGRNSNFTFDNLIVSPVPHYDLENLAFEENIKFKSFKVSENWQSFSSNATGYWNNRPSVLLNTIRRKKSKCKKAQCKFKIYNNISPELRQHYWHVYNKSWKPAEASPEFINWLLDYTSEQGLLRLGFTYIDCRPIAMHFWIVQDGTASIFKLAQDKEFDHLSPGTVLMAEMIDWVYAHDEIHCIDFLTGSDEYKKLWMDECRPLYGLEIFNMKTIRGRLLWYRHCIIRFLKSIRSRFNKHE